MLLEGAIQLKLQLATISSLLATLLYTSKAFSAHVYHSISELISVQFHANSLISSFPNY